MEYWREGSTSSAISPISTPDIVSHHKIGGVTFGAPLIYVALPSFLWGSLHFQKVHSFSPELLQRLSRKPLLIPVGSSRLCFYSHASSRHPSSLEIKPFHAAAFYLCQREFSFVKWSILLERLQYWIRAKYPLKF